MAEQKERKAGLSGSTLKMIALITMLIDHIAAIILARILRVYVSGESTGLDVSAYIDGQRGYEAIYNMYALMRNIGRIAFPIFCFLLIQGFEHTKDRKKYALRLAIFALISEIPFDLAFKGRLLEFSYQNVFVTLFLGLVTIMVFDAVSQKGGLHKIVRTLLMVAVVLAGTTAAELLRTDYGALGVLCILVLYLFRYNRMWQILAGCLSFFWWELPAVIGFIPISLYNGKRGWNLKYLFYVFYPLHLFILYIVCQLMGIAGIPAT